MSKRTGGGNSTAAVAYLRVSTAEQAQSGLGLAAQEERVRAYATMAGLDLVAVVRDEGVSGGNPIATRAGGAEVLRLVRTRKVEHVVALKLDRLFRDAADCLTQTRAWDKAGVALHLLDMGGQAINTATAMGRMFLTMAAGFAELEKNLIGERTSSALQVKRARGEKTGGDMPYGYRLDADGVHLVADADEQAVVARVRELSAAGASLRAVCRQLTADDVAPRKGAWHPQKVKNILDRAS